MRKIILSMLAVATLTAAPAHAKRCEVSPVPGTVSLLDGKGNDAMTEELVFVSEATTTCPVDGSDAAQVEVHLRQTDSGELGGCVEIRRGWNGLGWNGMGWNGCGRARTQRIDGGQEITLLARNQESRARVPIQMLCTFGSGACEDSDVSVTDSIWISGCHITQGGESC